MARSSSKKRPPPLDGAGAPDSASEDEFQNGLLDLSLSQSEEDSSDSGEEEEGEEEDESGQDFGDGDSDDGLDSDEISSSDSEEEGGEGDEKALQRLDGEDAAFGRKVVLDSSGNPRYIYPEIDPVYDSDDTDAEETNTIGNIPLEFYDEFPHVGYDINGKKIMRPAKGAALDALLDSIEVPKGWTGVTDRNTGMDLILTQEELEMVRKIQMGDVPVDGYDPYAVSFNNTRFLFCLWETH